MNKTLSLIVVMGFSSLIMACSDDNAGYRAISQYDILSSKTHNITDLHQTLFEAVFDTSDTKKLDMMKRLKIPNGKSTYQVGKECTAYLYPTTDLQNQAVIDGVTIEQAVDNFIQTDSRMLKNTVNICITIHTKILQQHLFVDNGDGTGRIIGNVR